MKIEPATSGDAPTIAALVNRAYRGDESRFGWTTEADYLDGSRISEARVHELMTNGKTILVLRENESILGCVYLERVTMGDQEACYLGMLTVDPRQQDRKLGRALLAQAERYAWGWGARCMTLGVIQLRGTLMAWYERRGYQRTSITEPFPYDQPELGLPKRKDLHFVMFEKTLSPP